jgi:hypothetical protein
VDLMTDVVCYSVVFDKVGNKPTIMIGRSEKDIVEASIEWSERIISMDFISDNVYITAEAANDALE